MRFAVIDSRHKFIMCTGGNRLADKGGHTPSRQNRCEPPSGAAFVSASRAHIFVGRKDETNCSYGSDTINA